LVKGDPKEDLGDADQVIHLLRNAGLRGLELGFERHFITDVAGERRTRGECDLTIDLAWPKMTADASDLEFGVTITPDRKVVTKFGWEWAGVKKVYLDVVGNNP